MYTDYHYKNFYEFMNNYLNEINSLHYILGGNRLEFRTDYINRFDVNEIKVNVIITFTAP